MKHTPLIYLLFLLPLLGCFDARMEGYEVHGIDVSHYQEEIDWDTVATQDIRFAFVKASEGETMKDNFFETNWTAIQEAGLLRGAYHFFIPSLDAETQAQNFISAVVLEDGDLPPVLDLEVTTDQSTSDILAGARVWMDKVEAHYGVKPILYTGLNFYLQHLEGEFEDHPIWIARYSRSTPKLDQDWQFWQYSNRGGLEGIDGYVDLNVFHGSFGALQDLCLTSAVVVNE